MDGARQISSAGRSFEGEKMLRRHFLKVTSFAAAASALATPAIAEAMPELRWRLTSSFPKSLDTIYGTAEVFAKAVADATDNKFQIQVFASGEIVPGLNAADAVQRGAVEMCQTPSYYYFGKDPAFAFGTAVPFGFNSRMQTAWMDFGGGMELMNELYKKFNIYGIPAGNTGAQMGGWFRKAGRVISKLGVVPQQIAGGDVYQALERGTLDACEWVGPYDDEKLGLHKVAQYYYYPGWWEGGPMLHHFINLERWNDLPRSYKTIVRSCSALANEMMLAKYDAANPAALKRLLAGGAQLRPFPPAIMDASLRAALDVYAEIGRTNPDFRKTWEAMLAFRNDQYSWWQVAELGYDAYLARNYSRT
jgi:TRAP-type mannitol/chloroaromatic compound transport system substrate-binding protein